MELYPNTYYHLYNRTNNSEMLFRESANYLFFLKQYRKRFENKLNTIAYCLMPTHFHFLIEICVDNPEIVSKQVGIWLSSYTKAVNKRYKRYGSLLQQHTKAIAVDDDSYILTLVTYIHQNPVRAGLVDHLESWEYSSYLDYIGKRNGSLPKMDTIQEWFESREAFREFSEKFIDEIDSKYWIS